MFPFVCLQVSTVWTPTHTFWICWTVTLEGSGSSSWNPAQAEGCDMEAEDRLKDGQILEQAAERAYKKKKKKRKSTHLHSPLSPLPVLFNLGAPWERETDGGSRNRKRQKSARSRAWKLSVTRWSSCAFFPFLSLPLSHSALFSLLLHHLSRGHDAESKKAADVTHYFRRRTCCMGRRGGRGPPSFPFKQSCPAMSEQVGMLSTSGYRERAQTPPLFSGQSDSVSFFHEPDSTWFRCFLSISLARLVSSISSTLEQGDSSAL